MVNGARAITRYRLIWLAIIVAVVAVTLLAVFARPFTPVAIEDVKSAVREDNPPGKSYSEEKFGQLVANMQELELSLSSGSGDLRLRVWAEQASKDKQTYQITNGALQFAMENHNTLLVRVEDAKFAAEEHAVSVSGSLTGYITGSNQYFEARRLSWDMNTNEVQTEKVMYIAPNIQVSGECMCLDMDTGNVRFEGTVEASV
ncbi:hypothetical protein JW859_05130 [bacterium]|nr:hypothetical protein [bacterium]